MVSATNALSEHAFQCGVHPFDPSCRCRLSAATTASPSAEHAPTPVVSHAPSDSAAILFKSRSLTCAACWCVLSILALFAGEALANGASGPTGMSISVGFLRSVDPVSENIVRSTAPAVHAWQRCLPRFLCGKPVANGICRFNLSPPNRPSSSGPSRAGYKLGHHRRLRNVRLRLLYQLHHHRGALHQRGADAKHRRGTWLAHTL